MLEGMFAIDTLQDNEVTRKVKNKIVGYLLDSKGMLAMMYVNDKYKEQYK